MIRFAAISVLTVLVFCVSSPGGAQASDARNPFAPKSAETQAPAAPPGALERSYRGLLLKIAAVQRDLNKDLHAKLKEIETTGSILPALIVIGLAFLYGVFHAAGPGHGKFIVTSYFLARDGPVSHGIIMSGLIALTQAISAIIIVFVLVFAMGLGRIQVLGYAVTIELVSYALVILLGIYMAWGAFRGKDCDHSHGPADSHHDHDHHHPDKEGPWYRRGRDMIVAAVAAGIRPCSGAIILLLFTMANGLYAVGIFGALAMAFGVAITVSAVGLLAIGARRTIIHATDAHGAVQLWILRGVGMLGALFVVTIGALLFLAALERVPGLY
jgi:nickel/cobalt transporter (NicO) family protein